jgi:hypothetical protein
MTDHARTIHAEHWGHLGHFTLPMLALLACLSSPGFAADPTPTAKEVLAAVGFSADVEQQILSGKIVKRSLASTSDRDLVAGLAFLIRKPPEAFVDDILRKDLVLKTDANTLEMGKFSANGSLSDLGALKLSDKEKKRYAAAKAGENANLSTAEIAALKALGGNEGAVEAEMKKILLARYRAYKKDGLAGIEHYDRGGKKYDPAAELRGFSNAAQGVKKFDPVLFSYLTELPKNPPTDLQEVFRWTRYRAHGEPTLILTHAFSSKIGGAIAAVQRQYYVSGGYNVEQAAVGFIPVKEGTLVVYSNHTSSDQVTGFGGSAKRSIGEKLMASQLQSLFEKLQSASAN